jgi:hypothetical protein
MATVDARIPPGPGFLYNEGCASGGSNGITTPEQGIVVLNFGQAQYQNGQYGTWLYNNTFVSVGQIQAAAQAWLQGYWDCSPSYPFMNLAVGTTNCGNGGSNCAVGDNVTSGHGQAWANLVTNLNTWIQTPRPGLARGYASQETALGAMDMEVAWNTPGNSRGWSNGYGINYTRGYRHFGDAAGCPETGQTSTNRACPTNPNYGWTQEDLWYVAWGNGPAWSLPQMYNTAGAQAREWQQISLYGFLAHGNNYIKFDGAFTQAQACLDHPNPPCSGTNNSPGVGWSQFWDALYTDSRTAFTPSWLTDVTWNN